MSPTDRYSIFGLVVESEIELLELPPSRAPADVHVRIGAVPAPLADPVAESVLYQASPGVLRLKVPNVATFLVTDGRDVLVAPVDSAGASDIRLFLYGSAMGAILQQRHVLTLHASAVTDGERAVLFAGPSGHGKSTLATSMVHDGYRLLSDDVVAVRVEPERGPVAFASYPQVKLWADALERLEIDETDLHRVRAELEKSYLPLVDQFATQPVPISHVFVLHPYNRNEIELESIRGRAKMAFLIHNTYRRQFLDGLGGKEAHFEGCVALSEACEVVRVRRPAQGFQIEELRAAIVEHLESAEPTA